MIHSIEILEIEREKQQKRLEKVFDMNKILDDKAYKNFLEHEQLTNKIEDLNKAIDNLKTLH